VKFIDSVLLLLCISRLTQMRHDPVLSPSFELPPLSWREAGPSGVGSEEDFLEGIKDGLDRCGTDGVGTGGADPSTVSLSLPRFART